MAEMLERYLCDHKLERGQIVSGVIVRASQNEVILDIGAKCEGIVPERDLERLSPPERAALRAGEEVMVCVITPEDANGNIILSLSRAQLTHDWHTALELFKLQDTIERPVAGCNKGGVIVSFGKIRGFVPGSQLAASRVADQSATGQDSDSRWESLIGETLQLKVIEVDQKRNRLILSEKAAMRDWRQNRREKMLDELTEGDVRRGKIINLADFGAFVDLGGLDGLVHLSELSWKRVTHPREVVEAGQELDVYVLKVDRERQRVALSLKRLQPDPWLSVEERYQEGQLVEGVITRLTKWGAFASVVGDEAIEGLVHISELTNNPVIHPREVIKPDQVVTLRIIGLDAENHRLSLSLKRVDEGEFRGEDWKAALAADRPEPQSSLSAALSDVIESSEERLPNTN
ncbi:MAG: S1 RNA-binding domain-containing protein [Anaerolineae bacterium]|nr:S1 RNA-binding domain-containing protein [Anaerolineae bacterium]